MCNSKLVDIEIFECRCNTCNNEFEFYDLPEGLYGERIFRTAKTQVPVLEQCLIDPTWKQVRAFVHKCGLTPGNDVRKESDIFDKIFVQTCDLVNGEELVADTSIICPECGSIEIERWISEPIRVNKVCMPMISHAKWNTLSLIVQEQQLKEFLFGTVVGS